MRWTVMNQMAKGLPETVGNDEEQYELRPRVLKDLESLQWYLWHGNVFVPGVAKVGRPADGCGERDLRDQRRNR